MQFKDWFLINEIQHVSFDKPVLINGILTNGIDFRFEDWSKGYNGKNKIVPNGSKYYAKSFSAKTNNNKYINVNKNQLSSTSGNLALSLKNNIEISDEAMFDVLPVQWFDFSIFYLGNNVVKSPEWIRDKYEIAKNIALDEIVDNVFVPKYTNRKVVMNKGSNTAHEVRQYRWKTKLGNIVKLQYKEKSPESYDVRFYVNETMYDNASKTTENLRDSEILPAIFSILSKNSIKAKEISFTAICSEGDIKTVRNLPVDNIKNYLLKEIENIERVMRSHVVKLVDPTQASIDIHLKLKRPAPAPKPDFNSKIWFSWFAELKEKINSMGRTWDFRQDLFDHVNRKFFEYLNYDFQNFLEAMRSFDEIVQSHSESGWKRDINRREVIYEKLIKKYMPEWTIEKDRNHFKLSLD